MGESYPNQSQALRSDKPIIPFQEEMDLNREKWIADKQASELPGWFDGERVAECHLQYPPGKQKRPHQPVEPEGRKDEVDAIARATALRTRNQVIRERERKKAKDRQRKKGKNR